MGEDSENSSQVETLGQRRFHNVNMFFPNLKPLYWILLMPFGSVPSHSFNGLGQSFNGLGQDGRYLV